MAKKTDYQKERAIWYAKLKEDGFEDIEQDEDNLKVWSSYFSRKAQSREFMESKTTYYYLATKFLDEYEFETPLDKSIWTYHEAAVSVRDIAKILAKAKIVDVSYVTIWKTIERLSFIMKKLYLAGYTEPNE